MAAVGGPRTNETSVEYFRELDICNADIYAAADIFISKIFVTA